tara:strand:- start:45254 stop:46489 length:1236 start_codon:yes stop_codon:yes gene_type:complete
MIEYILATIGLILSALFSGAEITFHKLHSNIIQISVWKEQGNLIAKKAENLIKNPEKYITTILLGLNLSNVLVSSFTTIILYKMQIPELYILIIISLIILIFGEILPKSFCHEYPNKFALFFTKFFQISDFLLKPVVWIFRNYTKQISISEKQTNYSRKELAILFEEIELGDDLEKDEKEVITNIFEFGQQSVKNSMTPKHDIIGIEQDRKISDAIDIIISSGLSKIVQFEKDLNNINGIIYLNDLLNEPKNLSDIIHNPLFIHENMSSSDALKELRKYRLSMAIIVESSGKTLGLVTIEDLIEEIFGEFEDIFDKETKKIIKLSDNSFIIDGRIYINELIKYKIFLPKGNYETIGGYIIEKLGKIPEKGNTLNSEFYKIRVLKASSTQVQRIQIIKKSKIESFKVLPKNK